MKNEEIEVGKTYEAKVARRSIEVRIDGENPKGGWNATAIASGKPVRIKNAQALRPAAEAGEQTRVVEDEAQQAPADETQAAPSDEPPPAKGKKKSTSAKAAPKEKKPREKEAPKEGKGMSLLDAAAVVLKGKGEPMRCKDIVAAVVAKGMWSTKALTPEATLYSAILREVTTKKNDSRFKKADRGLFEHTGK
jgi:hypothetical protein